MGWLIDRFVEKPAQWIFLGLFLVSLYGHWQRGRDLSRVCGLAGVHDWSIAHPGIVKREIDGICADRQPAAD
jgi:hypothetical protein